EMARPDFFGTAFAVGPGVFMTADHVVEEASGVGQLAIGGPSSRDGQPIVGAARAVAVERWPERDIALLFCNVNPAETTVLDHWLGPRVQVLTDLGAFGYPHAVTQSPEGDRYTVVFRGYKGHMITVGADSSRALA